MGKALAFIFLCFAVLVAFNWLSSVTSGVFSDLTPPYSVGSAVAAPTIAHGEDGLSFIDFNLFDKGGIGQNYVTQGYGHTPYSSVYPNDWHDGIDIAAAYGAPIYAPDAVTVIATGNEDDYCYHKSFGKYIALADMKRKLVLWFGHLGTINVTPGEVVEKGAMVATVGATGFETGVHLHLSIFDGTNFHMEVRNGCGPEPTGRDVNPFNYLGTVYN